MIRVLHLLECDADYESERTAGALRRALGPDVDLEVTTRRIGRGGRYRGTVSAVLSLRHAREQPFDLVHAFDERSLTAAALAGTSPIVFTPAEFPHRRSVRWIRGVMRHRHLEVACPTRSILDRLVRGGVPAERCELIRPGVDFTRIRRRRDAALRRALGFSDEERVLLVPGESTRPAAHEDAVWAGSIVHLLDRRYKVLVWGRGERADFVAARAEHLALPRLVTLAERRLGRCVEFEELIPAADMALIAAAAPTPILPVGACMAAGLPIVSVAADPMTELLRDGRNAVLVRREVPRLAKAVLDLDVDPPSRSAVGDAARADASEELSLTRMIEQYHALYSKVAEAALDAVLRNEEVLSTEC